MRQKRLSTWKLTIEGNKIPKCLLGEASELSISDHRLKFKIPARSGVTLN